MLHVAHWAAANGTVASHVASHAASIASVTQADGPVRAAIGIDYGTFLSQVCSQPVMLCGEPEILSTILRVLPSIRMFTGIEPVVL